MNLFLQQCGTSCDLGPRLQTTSDVHYRFGEDNEGQGRLLYIDDNQLAEQNTSDCMLNKCLIVVRGVRATTTSVANPPAPYSIQKCPEPQICPKFFPMIVFRGSSHRDPNLSKICPKIEKLVRKLSMFDVWTNFWQIWAPLTGTSENNCWDKFLDKFGVWGIFECCKGPEGLQYKGKTV